jgi:translation initiation factor IF-1
MTPSNKPDPTRQSNAEPKEDSMSNQPSKEQNDRGGAAGGRAYPTHSHELMGMTHQELLSDMAARGETVEDALAMFARVESSVCAIATRGRILGAQRELIEAPPAMAFVCGLRIYDESVAAGTGAFHSSDAQHRTATLSDFFGKHAWASIRDGDVVLVDIRRKAGDGDIVLAHLGGHGQLIKRLRMREGRAVMLESANEDFEPIEIGDSLLTIQGVVVGRAGRL